MSTTETPDQSLHLPSLVIKNFRGIDELTIPRLGRVTLLAGKNGVGKTTVLDAVRVWADRGRFRVLEDVLYRRGDTFIATDQQSRHRAVPDWYAYFTDRRNSLDIEISIGTIDDADVLQIGWQPQVKLQSDQATMYEFSDLSVAARPAISVKFGGSVIYPAAPSVPFPPSVLCNELGPDSPDNTVIERYWNKINLTPQEDMAVEALNLVTNETAERIAMQEYEATPQHNFRKRLMAKVKGKDYPVPLRTLGDGAVRTFAVALALANSANGFLLIDEVENGIHHSIQPKFWEMVLQTAQRNNVQVLATTHSWDAVDGFSRALTELELGDADGVLYRIQRNLHHFRAVEYDKRQLEIITTSRIEAR